MMWSGSCANCGEPVYRVTLPFSLGAEVIHRETRIQHCGSDPDEIAIISEVERVDSWDEFDRETDTRHPAP